VGSSRIRRPYLWLGCVFRLLPTKTLTSKGETGKQAARTRIAGEIGNISRASWNWPALWRRGRYLTPAGDDHSWLGDPHWPRRRQALYFLPFFFDRAPPTKILQSLVSSQAQHFSSRRCSVFELADSRHDVEKLLNSKEEAGERTAPNSSVTQVRNTTGEWRFSLE